MILNYVKSESAIRPELIDTTSSKTTVYLRKDITEKQRTNDMSNEKVTYYEYLEAKMTEDEYRQYLKELEIIDIQQQRADIDYLAIMTGVEL